MRFSDVGYRTIAYASFAYMWFIGMSSLSSIITIIMTSIGHIMDKGDLITMIMPSVFGVLIIGSVQLGVVYLIFRFCKGRVDIDYDYSISFLFAGAIIGLSVLTQVIYLPVALIDLVVLFIREDIFRSGQQFYLGGQVVILILECIVVYILLKKSNLELFERGHD